MHGPSKGHKSMCKHECVNLCSIQEEDALTIHGCTQHHERIMKMLMEQMCTHRQSSPAQPSLWIQPWAEQAGLVKQLAQGSCPSQSHLRHQPTQRTHPSCQCMPTLPLIRTLTSPMSLLTWNPRGHEKVHDKRAFSQCRHIYLLCTLNTTCMGMSAVQQCHQYLAADYVRGHANAMLSLPAHVCSRLHLPCSITDCQVCVQHAPLQAEPCFAAAKMQQTSCYQCMQTHSLPSIGPTITNTADSSTSALQAFSSTCVCYAPRLPSAAPLGQHAIRLCWLIASGVDTVHAKVLTIIQILIPTTHLHVQCSWHQHCHDTHVSSEVIQAVKTLTSDLHMQTRSLAELTGKIILQTYKHISFALVGLLIPCAVTVAVQAIHVLALVSISLLQSIRKLTKAAPRKRMQCSILYYLLKSVYCVDGSTHLSIILCDALILLTLLCARYNFI